MSGRTKLAALIIAIIGFALVPVATAVAGCTPVASAQVCTDGGVVSASANQGLPPVLGHPSGASATASHDGNPGHYPVAQACGQVAGIGACGRSASDGAVVGAPGVCAWASYDWAGGWTSGEQCANAKDCYVSGAVGVPDRCRFV